MRARWLAGPLSALMIITTLTASCGGVEEELPPEEISRVRQSIGILEVLGAIKAIYSAYKTGKEFYDTYIAQKVSEEELALQQIINTMNDLYTRETLTLAKSALTLYRGACSVNPQSPNYELLLYPQLSNVLMIGEMARSRIVLELNNASRPARYSARLAEVYTLLTPIMAHAAQQMEWDPSVIKSTFFTSAHSANYALLGPAAVANHPELPLYTANQGKLERARDEGELDWTELEELRRVVWTGQEEIKAQLGLSYSNKVFWIGNELHRQSVPVHRYNQCIVAPGGQPKTGDCLVGFDQVWLLRPEAGYLKLQTIGAKCLTRQLTMLYINGSYYPILRLVLATCADDLASQRWHWESSKLRAPAEQLKAPGARQYLDLSDSGALRLASSYTNFWPFRPYEAEDMHTALGGATAYRHLGSPVFYYPSKTFGCPAGMAVQGVIGSSGIKNLGLICAPRGNASLSNQLAQATVISYGTTDVNSFTTPTTGTPFWSYYLNVRTVSWKYQTYRLCPQGYFVNSIKAHFHPADYLFALERLTCVKSRDLPVKTVTLPASVFGTLLPSSEPWYFRREIGCPMHDSVYVGMKVYRGGEVTGGFEGHCAL